MAAIEALLALEVSSRDELRDRIAPLMRESRAIHAAFGPESDHPPGLQEEAAEMRQRQVFNVILPNNRRIYAFLAKNADLLSASEVEAMQDFYAHMIAFEYNQLSGEPVSRHPAGQIGDALHDLPDSRRQGNQGLHRVSVRRVRAIRALGLLAIVSSVLYFASDVIEVVAGGFSSTSSASP